jgi:hypothetical protein
MKFKKYIIGFSIAILLIATSLLPGRMQAYLMAVPLFQTFEQIENSSYYSNLNYPAEKLAIVSLNPKAIDLSLVRQNDLIKLDMFNNESYTATVEDSGIDSLGVEFFSGSLNEYALGYYQLLVYGSNIRGKVVVPEKDIIYHIQSCSDSETIMLSRSSISEMSGIESAPSPSALFKDDIVDDVQISKQMIQQVEPLISTANETVIDLMVVYTPQAKAYADSYKGSISIALGEALADSREVLSNSNINLTFRLPYFEQIDYVESGDIINDLKLLTFQRGQTNTEGEVPDPVGYMDQVHAIRDEYGADLVILLVSDSEQYGGIAWQLEDPSGDDRVAFSVVVLKHAAYPNNSFIHEIAHNLGCDHHAAASMTGGVFDYSHGWQWDKPFVISDYSTIMAHTISSYIIGLSTPVPYFSSPDLYCPHTNEPMGSSSSADNVRTIKQMKHIIAAYRCVVSGHTAPSGPGSGYTGILYGFQVSDYNCSSNHPLEYRFNWGDGSYSEWSSSLQAFHLWNNPGNYQVSTQSRCSVNKTSISDWSTGKTVSINQQSEPVPTVRTEISVANITETSAQIWGRILDDGGSPIANRRFDWGTTTTLDKVVYSGAITAQGDYFFTTLSNLSPDTTYYYRAWAQNSSGWGNGVIQSFTTMKPVLIKPAAPTLISPVNWATGVPTRPTFEWTADDNASIYLLKIAAPHFDQALELYTTNTTYTLPLEYQLLEGTLHGWTVQAGNAAGFSENAPMSVFTTNAAPLETGAIEVIIEPSGARSVGAQWRLTSGPDQAWKTSGSIISNLVPGNYIITYNTISGWLKPANATVSVSANTITMRQATYVAESPQCSLVKPNKPSGPSSGYTNSSYNFNSSDLSCSGGHNVEYRFDWGNGSFTNWISSPSANKVWQETGTYIVKIQARCAVDRSILSEWSSGHTINISETPCTARVPNSPSGDGPPYYAGEINRFRSFAGATSCSNSHLLEFQFDWGDGTYSDWVLRPDIPGYLLPVEAYKTWASTGTYNVRVRSRCSVTRVQSNWSSSVQVNVTAAPLCGAPVPNSPSGKSGLYFTDENHRFLSYAGSSYCTNSHISHLLEFQFDWGDGTYSDWVLRPVIPGYLLPVEAYKTWTTPGIYDVRIRSRCSVTHAHSRWTAGLEVIVYDRNACTVFTPNVPKGAGSCLVGSETTFIADKSGCVHGHDIEYLFDWDDGTYSEWSSSPWALKTWNSAAIYQVRVKARCTESLEESMWSEPRLVEASAQPSVVQDLGKLQIGDRVIDKSWVWAHLSGDNYTGDGVIKPVTWIIVSKGHYSVEGGYSHVTLLSEESIASYLIDNSNNRKGNRSHWGNSGTHDAEHGLRPFLNSLSKSVYSYTGAGFYDAFSSNFKNKIVTTILPNRLWSNGSSYTTNDKVFIPSLSELGGEPDYTHTIGTIWPYFVQEATERRKAVFENNTRRYWTRSPDINPDSLYAGDLGVYIDGNGDYRGASRVTIRHFVRPALNIKIDTPVSILPNADGVFEIVWNPIEEWHSVDLLANRSEGVELLGKGLYPKGSFVTVSALAEEESLEFVSWLDGNTSVSNEPVYSFYLDQDLVLTANILSNKGSIKVDIHPESAVQDGAMWSIDNGLTWRESGEEVSGLTFGDYTITYKDLEGWVKPEVISTSIENDSLITENGYYNLLVYEVILEADPEIGGMVSGMGIYNHGEDAVLLAMPNEGYSFVGWFENEEILGKGLIYSFGLQADRHITARFIPVESLNYDFSIDLKKGWNLLSLHRRGDIHYNSHDFLSWLTFSDGIWTDDGIQEIISNPSRAVFVNAKIDTTIYFIWEEIKPDNEVAEMVLSPGWNLISSGIKADYNSILSGLCYNGTGGLTQLFAPNSYNGRKEEGYHLPWDNPLVSLTTPAQGSGEHMYPFDGYWVYLRGAGVTYSTPVGSDLP